MAKQNPTPATETGQDTAPVDLYAAKITLECGGEKFEVPKRRGQWPVEAILQFGRGQGMQGIRALLGAEDWERLKKVCPTGDDFDVFADKAVDILTAEAIR